LKTDEVTHFDISTVAQSSKPAVARVSEPASGSPLALISDGLVTATVVNPTQSQSIPPNQGQSDPMRIHLLSRRQETERFHRHLS